ncbi:hypothetical protein [Armatimonas sp.]
MFKQEKTAAAVVAPKLTKEVMADAMKTARKQKKTIFVHFGASW